MSFSKDANGNSPALLMHPTTNRAMPSPLKFNGNDILAAGPKGFDRSETWATGEGFENQMCEAVAYELASLVKDVRGQLEDHVAVLASEGLKVTNQLEALVAEQRLLVEVQRVMAKDGFSSNFDLESFVKNRKPMDSLTGGKVESMKEEDEDVDVDVDMDVSMGQTPRETAGKQKEAKETPHQDLSNVFTGTESHAENGGNHQTTAIQETNVSRHTALTQPENLDKGHAAQGDDTFQAGATLPPAPWEDDEPDIFTTAEAPEMQMKTAKKDDRKSYCQTIAKEDSRNSDHGVDDKIRDTLADEKTKGKGMFGEVAGIGMEDYDVANLYYKRGLAQAIARNDTFANMTLVVISANAMYIGYDAEFNNAASLLDAELQFIACDNFFCMYFFFEWTMRFLAFEVKLYGFKDRWFMFDTILVVLIVVETWILPFVFQGMGDDIPLQLLKLPRLLRLARMGRLVRSFPELVAMIKGVKVASRAVGSAFMLLFGLVYVFSIMMFLLLQGYDDVDGKLFDRYGDMGKTMWTLLIDAAFMDGLQNSFNPLLDSQAYMAFCALFLFVLLSALTVMNMLIGVLCEVVSAVAAAEKEEMAIRLLKGTLLQMLKALDADGSGEIDASEIKQVFEYQEALDVLDDLKVDVNYLVDSLNMFFEYNGGSIGMLKVMDLILMLRGDRTPTMKDMIHGQTFARWKVTTALKTQEKRIVKKLKDFQKTVGDEVTNLRLTRMGGAQF